MCKIIPIADMPEKKTSDRQRRDIDLKAELNRKKNVSSPQIEIHGKLIAECFADLQLEIVKQTIVQLHIELNKLEHYLNEVKNYENNKKDFSINSIDAFRFLH
jgi:hypothetical protein